MRVAVIGLVCLLSTGIATAGAQEREFGVKVGPIIGTVTDSTDPDASYGRRISLSGGGFVVVPMGGRLAAQIEALVSRKGGTEPTGQEDLTATMLLDYFEVPILARITVARTPSRAFYVFGGPSAGFRTSAKYQVAASGDNFTNGYIDDISADVTRFELGAIAGGGVDFGRHVVVDARYFWGLTNVNRDSIPGSLRNRALTILAGYRF